jgi:hypothetical protein
MCFFTIGCFSQVARFSKSLCFSKTLRFSETCAFQNWRFSKTCAFLKLCAVSQKLRFCKKICFFQNVRFFRYLKGCMLLEEVPAFLLSFFNCVHSPTLPCYTAGYTCYTERRKIKTAERNVGIPSYTCGPVE